MKKQLLLFASLFLAMLANAQYTLTDDDVMVNAGYIYSVSYDFTVKDIIIPETLDGQTVIGITNDNTGHFANKGITAIQFPATMQNIGNNAFSGNSIDSVNLTTCTDLNRIGKYTFNDCPLDTVIINTCSSLETIGDHAFYGQSLNEVDLSGCTKLINIGEYAFGYGASGANPHFYFPQPDDTDNFLYWVGDNGLRYNPGDKSPSASIGYEAIIYHTFTDDDVEVVEGVIQSCSYAFYSNSKAISIPDTLDGQTVIGIANDDYGIFKNEDIIALKLSSTLEFIGKNAFYNNDIETLDLSTCTKLKTIGENCFYSNNISFIDFSNTTALEHIAYKAFSSSKIDSIDFSGCTALKEIGAQAFYNNVLEKAIDLSPCTALTIIRRNGFYSNNFVLPTPNYQGFKYWVCDGKTYQPGDQHPSAYYDVIASVPYTLTDADVTVANGEITACSYDFTFSHIIIPETLHGQTITGIANTSSYSYAPFYEKPITGVEFPATIQKIGNYAFYDCINLLETNLGECPELTRINYYAFWKCPLRYADFSASTKLSIIEQRAFYECELDSVNFSGCTALKTIEQSAFYGNNIDSLNLNACTQLSYIGNQAFEYNYIDTLIIDQCTSLKHIGDHALYSYYLEKKGVFLPDVNHDNFEYWTNGDEQFTSADTIFDLKSFYHAYCPYTLTDNDVVVENGSIVGCLYNFENTDIIIPQTLDGQTIIGIGDKEGNAPVFYQKGVTSVKLPATLTYIGAYAFQSNKDLYNVDFSACTALTYIGESAFRYCYLLKELNLQNCTALAHIGTNAFYHCKNLSKLNLGENSALTYIGESAFSYAGIDTLNLNTCSELAYIGRNAFYYNSSDTAMLNNCSKLAYMGKYALGDCQADSIQLPTPAYANAEGFTASDNSIIIAGGKHISNYSLGYAINNIWYTLTDNDVEVSNGAITACSYNFAIKNIIIPETLDGQTITAIEYIKNADISFQYKDLKKVQLPATVETIGRNAFYSNNNLSEVNFHELTNLKTIGQSAFGYAQFDTLDFSPCTNLTYIGVSAFLYIGELKSVNFSGCSKLEYISKNAFLRGAIDSLNFTGCNKLHTIGNEAFSTNKLDTVDLSPCTALNFIGADAFNYNTEMTTYALPSNSHAAFTQWLDSEGNTYAGGDAILGWSYTYYADMAYTLTDDDVVVSNGIIDTCTYSFELKNIIIPETLDGQTVTGIASKDIGNNGVFAVKDIATVQLPTTIENIGDYAFYYNNIIDVNISDCNAISIIGNSAFRRNSLSGTIDLSNFTDLTEIGRYAFYYNSIDTVLLTNCTALQSIKYGAFNNNEIDSLSLSNCTALLLIGANAFDDNNLKNIDLSSCNELYTIGYDAFSDNQLTQVSLAANTKLSYIGEYAFDEEVYEAGIALPTHSNANFIAWKDKKGNTYATGDNLPNLEMYYYAEIPYTLQGGDVVINNGIIEGCTYNFESKTITIPETLNGQTVIGVGEPNGVWGVFQSKYICSLNLPTTLETIGDKAFYSNYYTSIDLSANADLTHIGDDALNAIYFGSFFLPEITNAPQGYEFVCWYNERYDHHASGELVDDWYTYTALFGLKDYEIVFNANNGEGTMANQAITFGTIEALTTNTFTRTGYTFAEWNTAADGSGTAYADGADFTMSVEGITLYAQWSEGTSIENTIATNIKVYPNPASDVLTISNIKQGSRIMLFDAIGNKVLEQKSTGSEVSLNISGFKSGIYFVKVGTYTAKVIFE